VAWSLVSGLVLGQSVDPLSAMSDPTRPPAAFRKPAPGELSSTNGGAPGGAPEAPATPPKLQSVQRDARTGRTTAMLDGEIRQVGERVAGWSVLAIEADSVVVRGASGIVRLRLLGGQETLKQWRGVSAPSSRKDQP
jgi:hypothetical protein